MLVVTKDLQLALNNVNRQVLQLNVQEYLIEQSDEHRDLLSVNDKAAIVTVGVATPAMFTGLIGTVTTTSVAIAGIGSFGISAIAGAGLYLGYKWLLKNYNDEKDMKKAQWNLAKENHRLILEKIRKEIERIDIARQQLENAGQITINEVPINYRENECPIDLKPLIERDQFSCSSDSDGVQRPLERLPCGHILHQDCYTALLQSDASEMKLCPICRAPLISDLPDFVIFPVAAPSYNPQTAGQFVKRKIKAAMKETIDFVKIATIVAVDIAGTTLVIVGGGVAVLWVPTAIPMLCFIGTSTGQWSLALESVVCILGLAATSIVGGMSLCSFAVKNGLYPEGRVAISQLAD